MCICKYLSPCKLLKIRDTKHLVPGPNNVLFHPANRCNRKCSALKSSSCLLLWPMHWQILHWLGLMLTQQFCNLHLLSFPAQHPSPLWGVKQDPYVATTEIWTELIKQPKTLIQTGAQTELGMVTMKKKKKTFQKIVRGKFLVL